MKFAVMGHGVVGSGTTQLFFRNRDLIAAAAHQDITLKYILDIKDFPGMPYGSLFIKDFSRILNDPEIETVVECIGGVTDAYDYDSRCLMAGKNIVTSNKELIASRGTELMRYAEASGAMLKFEASVGGGIPLLKPLRQCLAANRINYIEGILNGTTNFILTAMENENMPFGDALALAGKLGYTELNPAADVDGIDCVRKISILCGLAFGRHPDPEKIPTEGIRNVTPDDMLLAKKLGGRIKLIARASDSGADISASVCPCLVTGSNLLSSVSDVFNAVLVNGDATGDVLFYGKGAGKFPTASAVISDVIDCACEKIERPIRWEDSGAVAPDLSERRFFLRYAGKPGGVSLPPALRAAAASLDSSRSGFVTEKMPREKLAELLGGCEKPDSVIPVLE